MEMKVTEEHNKYLLWAVEVQEVKDAIFSMHPDKSPSLKGMNPHFFKPTGLFWDKRSHLLVLSA